MEISAEIHPSRFVHITEKGAALLEPSGPEIVCREVTDFGVTDRRYQTPVKGVFSDAIASCLMIAAFADDGRIFACHLNADVVLDGEALPKPFRVAKIYIAYNSRKVAAERLRRAVHFAKTLGLNDDRIYLFDVIGNQACGFGLDGNVYRLNMNVRFDSLTLAPTADTRRNVLCGIRMHEFDERRVYNNRSRATRSLDWQFNGKAFLQHNDRDFDITAVVLPERDKAAVFTAFAPSGESSLAKRPREIEKVLSERYDFKGGNILMVCAFVAVLGLRYFGVFRFSWTIAVLLGLGVAVVFAAAVSTLRRMRNTAE